MSYRSSVVVCTVLLLLVGACARGAGFEDAGGQGVQGDAMMTSLDAAALADAGGGVGADAQVPAFDAGLGGVDAGSDAGAALMDAGFDAGRPDAGRPDAGRPDAGRPDAGFDAGGGGACGLPFTMCCLPPLSLCLPPATCNSATNTCDL